MATLFSPQTIDFLWGIRFNNNREWFQANKPTYEEHLLQPIRALGNKVYDAIVDAHPGLGLNLHISRIYRDARRLYGRGPFKDHLWFSIEQPSKEGLWRPSFYFTIGPERYGYGMGLYDARAATMQAYRQDIDRNPQRALELAERLQTQNTFVLSGPLYARSKGGPGGILDSWYNRRVLGLEFESAPDECLFAEDLAERMIAGFEFLMPYYEWLFGIVSRAEADGRDDR